MKRRPVKSLIVAVTGWILVCCFPGVSSTLWFITVAIGFSSVNTCDVRADGSKAKTHTGIRTLQSLPITSTSSCLNSSHMFTVCEINSRLKFERPIAAWSASALNFVVVGWIRLWTVHRFVCPLACSGVFMQP